MTLEEAQLLLPEEYKVEVTEGVGFMRCIVRGYMGQPKAIAEAADAGEAISRALLAFREGRRERC